MRGIEPGLLGAGEENWRWERERLVGRNDVHGDTVALIVGVSMNVAVGLAMILGEDRNTDG